MQNPFNLDPRFVAQQERRLADYPGMAPPRSTSVDYMWGGDQGLLDLRPVWYDLRPLHQGPPALPVSWIRWPFPDCPPCPLWPSWHLRGRTWRPPVTPSSRSSRTLRDNRGPRTKTFCGLCAIQDTLWIIMCHCGHFIISCCISGLGHIMCYYVLCVFLDLVILCAIMYYVLL